VYGSVAIISRKNVPIGLHVMYLYFADTPRTLGFNDWNITGNCKSPLILVSEHLLRKPLTVIDQFHSHLEPMKFLRQDTFHDQVSSNCKEQFCPTEQKRYGLVTFNNIQQEIQI